MTARMGRATPLADLTEKEWEAQLFNSQKGLAPALGWKLIYHTLRSKGSRSGFPDRVLVRDRVVYAEMKTEKGPTSDTQREWLTGLAAAGAETYLWRPSDLDEIATVLNRRWWFIASSGGSNPSLAAHGFTSWTPGSLWLPAGHRNDQTVQQELVA